VPRRNKQLEFSADECVQVKREHSARSIQVWWRWLTARRSRTVDPPLPEGAVGWCACPACPIPVYPEDNNYCDMCWPVECGCVCTCRCQRATANPSILPRRRRALVTPSSGFRSRWLWRPQPRALVPNVVTMGPEVQVRFPSRRCSLGRWLLCRRLPNPTRTWGRRSASWLIRRRRGLLLGFERLCSNSRRRPSTVVFRGWAGSTILGFRAHQAACVALMICNSQFQRATRFTAA
jgi:hypothetical protein